MGQAPEAAHWTGGMMSKMTGPVGSLGAVLRALAPAHRAKYIGAHQPTTCAVWAVMPDPAR